MLKLQGHRRKVCALAFSPNGRRLASITPRERRVSLWELPGGARTFSPGEPDEVQAIAFEPEGEFLVIASGRYLRRWDLGANTIENRWRRCGNYCRQVAIDPDGSNVVAVCFDRYGGARSRVDTFTPDSPESRSSRSGDYGIPLCLAFSPGGQYLAVGGESTRVRLLSKTEKVTSVQCRGNVLAVAFSADEKLIAVSAGKKLTLYDIATREPYGELTGHTGYVCALAVAPDGMLLSAADDGTARLWDVAARRERKCYDWKIGRLNAAAFSPDGTLAAVGGEDGIVIWDVE